MTIETIIVIAFLCMSLFFLRKKARKGIFFFSFAYLIFGLALLFYIIIVNIQPFLENCKSIDARPVEYFDYHIDRLLLYLTIALIVIRCNGIWLQFYCYYIMKKLDKEVQSELLISIVKEDQEYSNSDIIKSMDTTVNESKEASSYVKPYSNEYYKLILK
jgi:hypothetical protein